MMFRKRKSLSWYDLPKNCVKMSDSDIDELLDSDAENEKAAASDNTNLDTGQPANKNFKGIKMIF